MKLSFKTDECILNTSYIADYTGLTQEHVCNILRNKKLKGYKEYGKFSKWLVKRRDFENFLLKKGIKGKDINLIKKKICDITADIHTPYNFNPSTEKSHKMFNRDYKYIFTCVVSNETIKKIDKDRYEHYPLQELSTYVGEILDNMYVHRKI